MNTTNLDPAQTQDMLDIAKHLTTCKYCGAELRYYKQFSRFYGECVDHTCQRYAITLELNDLAALTEAQVQEYLNGKSA